MYIILNLKYISITLELNSHSRNMQVKNVKNMSGIGKPKSWNLLTKNEIKHNIK